MFRFFRFRRRELPPNVARIRLLPKRNLDRAVFGLAIGLSLLTSVPQDISRRLDKPIFIPLGFARETLASKENQIAFTEEDLATQRKVFEDKELRNKIKSTVAARLVAAQNAPPSVAFAKQCKYNFTWLFIKYPSRPPPEFERFCLKITGDHTTLVTQPVSPNTLYRMRVIFNPFTVFQAARRAYDTTFPTNGIVGLPSEPAGIRFVANLVMEIRKEWKPPNFIPRNHVVVEGLVELVGNGNLAVVEIDMSIDPNNLKDVIWRSAVVKYSGKFDQQKQKQKPGEFPAFDWTHSLELRKKMMEKKTEAAKRQKVLQERWTELQEREKERDAEAEKEAAKKKEEEESENGMVEVTPNGPKLYVPTPLPPHDIDSTPQNLPLEEQKDTDKEKLDSEPNQAQKETANTKESIDEKHSVETARDTAETDNGKKPGSQNQQSIANNGRAD